MSRIKNNPQTNKIAKKDLRKRGGECPQCMAFSFQHLTENNNYNFMFYLDRREKMVRAKDHLVNRLLELSTEDWRYWLNMKKSVGIEYADLSLNFLPKNYIIAKDEKIYSIRFKTPNDDNTKGRIIGIRKDSCPTFYVCGFDFDFTAYDHGSF